jgi:hypothetical protein
MALPVGNPILALWQETVANGGTLDDARERVAEPTWVAQVTEGHLAELHECLTSGALGDEALPVALLLFEVARHAEQLPAAARRQPMLAFWMQCLPGDRQRFGCGRPCFRQPCS